MTETGDILAVEALTADAAAVIFDLDDTLYSEKDYVKSGYRAACPEKAEQLWQAFLDGKPAFDTVIPEQKEEALARYRSHRPTIALYPGAAEMLKRIRRHARLGLITDGRPEGQRAKIEALGLAALFDEIIITDELGGAEFRKPNPAAFLEMQKRLGVPYEKMVYIGDNLKKDFAAPAALGMGCIHFINPDGLYR